MIIKDKSTPGCFGDLNTVFPKTAGGLRQSPDACLQCRHKVECLRSAVKGAQGLAVKEEVVDRAYSSGLISFWERWSRKKDVQRSIKAEDDKENKLTRVKQDGWKKRQINPSPDGATNARLRFSMLKLIIAGIISAVLLGVLYLFRVPLWEHAVQYYLLLTDREQSKAFISSFGMAAPAVFVLFQILQVIFAPVPGEATGFIGGYLFGAGKGFVYSSVGLSIGSIINFSLGRFLGRHFVRKLVPADKLNRFDTILKRQAIVVIFILFVFPGFPKDYLCYFLGLSAIPWKAFVWLASVGRMPGTLMLSIQGAFLYERSYGLFALIAVVCVLSAWLGYRCREQIYQWVERLNKR